MAYDNDFFFCTQTGFFCPSTATSDSNAKVYSLTGTVDFALTQQLIVKTELRWDTTKDSSKYFPGVTSGDSVYTGSNGNFTKGHQILGGVEMTYKF
jgi:hypothetical protein